jgi:hypothetical protein
MTQPAALVLSVVLGALVALIQPLAKAEPVAVRGVIAGPSNTTIQRDASLASNSVPIASNRLDFHHQYMANASGDIGRLSFFDFDDLVTDVFNVTNGSAIGGSFVDRTVDSVSGDRGAIAIAIVAPAATIAEPETYALLLAGLAVVVAIAHRRSRP